MVSNFYLYLDVFLDLNFPPLPPAGPHRILADSYHPFGRAAVLPHDHSEEATDWVAEGHSAWKDPHHHPDRNRWVKDSDRALFLPRMYCTSWKSPVGISRDLHPLKQFEAQPSVGSVKNVSWQKCHQLFSPIVGGKVNRRAVPSDMF